MNKLLTEYEAKGCTDPDGNPLLTILDLRTESSVSSDGKPLIIKTSCKTATCLMDDLRNPEVRGRLPLSGLVVTITETGNRDLSAIRYLSQFGYKNIKGLVFGMRGWIKSDYPTAVMEGLKK